MLASNRMAEGAEAASGGVSVAEVSQMAAAVHELLGDPARLGRLAEAGRRDARTAGEWDPFVARVTAALATPDGGVARFATARVAVGRALASRERALTDRLGALEARMSELESQLGATSAHAMALDGELERALLRERELHAALDSAHRRYQALRQRKVVRAGLRLAGARERLRVIQLRR
jgi:hypothetical protein